MAQHRAIARLRGRAEPREDILNRILEINPSFRVGWIPPGIPIEKDGETYQRPAIWRIYEFRPNELRQAAAHASYRRFLGWLPEKQAQNPGLVFDLEDRVDCLHLVAEFSEDYFGQDRMFEDLKQTERDLAPYRDDMRLAQQQDAQREVEEEMDVNPEFSDYVREIAKDFYNLVKGNSSVAMTTPGAR